MDQEYVMQHLDPKIAPYVLALNQAGIATYESCQGGEGHCVADPMIRFRGDLAEGFQALSLAMQERWPVHSLQRVWTMIDGEPTGPIWQLVFVGSRI